MEVEIAASMAAVYLNSRNKAILRASELGASFREIGDKASLTRQGIGKIIQREVPGEMLETELTEDSGEA